MSVSVSCPICYRDYDFAEVKPLSGTCGHTICRLCRFHIIERGCPICMKDSFRAETPNFTLIELLEVLETQRPGSSNQNNRALLGAQQGRKDGKKRIHKGNSVVVQNFPATWTEVDLKTHFQHYGPIQTCKIMRNDDGKSRNIAFVNFANVAHANRALLENGAVVGGKELELMIQGKEPPKPPPSKHLNIVFPSVCEAPMCKTPNKWDQAPTGVVLTNKTVLVKVPLQGTDWSPQRMLELIESTGKKNIAFFDVCGRYWEDPRVYQKEGIYKYQSLFDCEESLDMLKKFKVMVHMVAKQHPIDLAVVMSPHCGELSLCAAIIVANRMQFNLNIPKTLETASRANLFVRTPEYNDFVLNIQKKKDKPPESRA